VPVTIDDLLLLSGLIAIGFLVAVAFYESLSTRDVLVRRSMRLARRISRRRWVAAIAYLLTVGVGIPILVVLWTLVLGVALFFVGSVEREASIAVIAVSVVAAARILAYVREKTAHELAKAIPLSFAFLLLTGGALNLDEKVAQLSNESFQFLGSDAMIPFLVVLEIGLRLVTDASHAALSWIRGRRGIESDLGIWRTLWAAVRRPLAATPSPVDDAGNAPETAGRTGA
jgi:hypothetical protein